MLNQQIIPKLQNMIIPLTTGIGIGFFLNYLLSKIGNQKKSNQPNSQNQNEKKLDNQEYQQTVDEILTRNKQFFGEEGLMKIKNSYIIVFGVGGVGSHVVSALVRSGVGRIKIIDFDQVTLSSLNRNAFATQDDVGKPKVECIKQFIHKIMPHIKVEIVQDIMTPNNVSVLLSNLDQKPNFVIDCIDNIDAKFALIMYCKKNDIQIVTSAGAGCKIDPTRLQIRDISESSYDDLARAIRKKLNKEGISKGITMIQSVERTTKKLLPLEDKFKENPNKYRQFYKYRLRVIPVVGTMPALFGYSIAAYVLSQLAEQPFESYSLDEVSHHNYTKLYNHLCSVMKDKFKINFDRLQFDREDVYVVTREVFNWQCVVTEKKLITGDLVVWDPEQEATIHNLVYMNHQKAQEHEKLKSLKEANYSQEVYDRVNQCKIKLNEFLSDKSRVIYN